MNKNKTNPQASRINQPQGPRVGNGSDNGTKRSTFLKEKQGGEKVALADMVMKALEARNPGFFYDPRVESLHADTGPKRNPTAGGTEYNRTVRAPKKITK